MTSPNLSFWEKDVLFPNPDILVIGSGIVGLNAALRLRELLPGARVSVVERGPLPTGASTRNAGFACFGSPSELLDDLLHHTEDEMLALVEKRWRGLARLREKLGDNRIDFLLNGGYEVFRPGDEKSYEACMQQLDRLNLILGPVIGNPRVFRPANEKKQGLGITTFAHLIENPFEGQLHPGKMMVRLADLAREKGVWIYSGLEVSHLESLSNGVEVRFESGWSLRPRKVLLATNGFSRRLLPTLPVTPARNQVLITQPIPGLALKGSFHLDKGYVYFRNVGERLLIGGFRNLDPEGEATDHFGFSNAILEALEELVSKYILPKKSWKVESQWSGILGVGPQKESIITEALPHVWTAVRLGGMGVAIGTLVGEAAAEALATSWE